MTDRCDCSECKKTLGALLENEIRAAHEAMDRKEAELDQYGYGGDPTKPPAHVEGLGKFLPYKGELVSMCTTGKFRVYFNRHGAEPLMWCISPEGGGWEIAVRDVQLSTIAETVYRKKETADEDDGRPSAWIACEGTLTINVVGFATIGSP